MASKKDRDASQLRKAQKGDKESLSVLCIRVRQRLVERATIAGVGQDTDEVVNNAMLAFLSKVNMIDPTRGTVIAFAKKILRDKIADIERRRTRTRELQVTDKKWQSLQNTLHDEINDEPLTSMERNVLELADQITGTTN